MKENSNQHRQGIGLLHHISTRSRFQTAGFKSK